MSNNAKQVRDLLKMSFFMAEFLRADVIAVNPMVWFIEVGGTTVPTKGLVLQARAASGRLGDRHSWVTLGSTHVPG
jgi:hypothetical protein